MPQPQTSIWGTILTCVEIGLHIYALQAERDQGIVLDADYAKKPLAKMRCNWEKNAMAMCILMM